MAIIIRIYLILISAVWVYTILLSFFAFKSQNEEAIFSSLILAIIASFPLSILPLILLTIFAFYAPHPEIAQLRTTGWELLLYQMFFFGVFLTQCCLLIKYKSKQ